MITLRGVGGAVTTGAAASEILRQKKNQNSRRKIRETLVGDIKDNLLPTNRSTSKRRVATAFVRLEATVVAWRT